MSLFRVFFALIFLTVAAQAQDSGQPETAQPAGDFKDPLVIYGNDIQFDIYRNGSKVGRHQVTFERRGEDLIASSRMDIAIKVMFITGYRFTYRSVETWAGARLKAIDVTVDDDGKKTSIHGLAEGEIVRVSGGKTGEIVAPPTIVPTTHWNSAQPRASVTLDTLDGILRDGPAERIGTEQVKTPTGSVEATHFGYTGGLKGTEVWYVNERWVKMRFRGRDGSVIEYRCVRCGV